MRGRRGPGPRALLAAVALLLAASCGLAEDDGPELLAPENVPHGLLDPETTTTTTTIAPGPRTTVRVYFVRQSDEGTLLQPVERQVTDALSVDQRLQVLLEQLPGSEDEEEGLGSSIPPDTTLLSVGEDFDSGEVVVDLSREFLEGTQIAGQRAAFAQVTCTAEQVSGIRWVRFKVDGEDIGPVVADGTQKDPGGRVSCQDYATILLPIDQPAGPDAGGPQPG